MSDERTQRVVIKGDRFKLPRLRLVDLDTDDIPPALLVIGTLMLAYGLSLLHPALPWIVVGALFILIGVRRS